MRYWTIVAISLSGALAGCGASSGSRDQAKPDIGGAPGYAVEVAVAPARESESPIVVADRERQGRMKANKIIRCLVRDREQTRATFLGMVAGAEPENCARPADAARGRRKAKAQ